MSVVLIFVFFYQFFFCLKIYFPLGYYILSFYNEVLFTYRVAKKPGNSTIKAKITWNLGNFEKKNTNFEQQSNYLKKELEFLHF